MRFQVPQFIETETKVIGPLTIKQFLFVAAWFVVVLIVGYTTSTVTTIVVAIIFGAIMGSFAFAKMAGMSLGKYALLALYYALSRKKYVFRPTADDEEGLADINIPEIENGKEE